MVKTEQGFKVNERVSYFVLREKLKKMEIVIKALLYSRDLEKVKCRWNSSW